MLGILRLAHGLGRISWYLLSVLKGELIKKKKKNHIFNPKHPPSWFSDHHNILYGQILS